MLKNRTRLLESMLMAGLSHACFWELMTHKATIKYMGSTRTG